MRSGTEVVVRVSGAAGVEGCVALGAAVVAFVCRDRQFGPAVPAQDHRSVELLWWPLHGGMVRRLGVAQVAGKVTVTAGEADGDDIEFGGVVDAPSVLIDGLAEDIGSSRHRSFVLSYDFRPRMVPVGSSLTAENRCRSVAINRSP